MACGTLACLPLLFSSSAGRRANRFVPFWPQRLVHFYVCTPLTGISCAETQRQLQGVPRGERLRPRWRRLPVRHALLRPHREGCVKYGKVGGGCGAVQLHIGLLDTPVKSHVARFIIFLSFVFAC